MRTLLFLATLIALTPTGTRVFAQATGGCHNMKDTAQKYFAENFGSEEKPVSIEHKIIRITPAISALQFAAPADAEEPELKPAVFTSFFGGTTGCEFLMQYDGEIAEILDIGMTKYVFVRHESEDPDQRHSEDQVLTVTDRGEVQPTRDQHGSEIFFSQTWQKRCNGQAGETMLWSRDNQDSGRITVRQRHTERDARCRVIEDSSSYRYYRLTPQYWEIDDGETEKTEAEALPAPAPVLRAAPHSR